MNLTSIILFVLVMVALAALPSASVALVVTRSATRGFRNGIAVAAGIVLADLVFATLAMLGMVALAQSTGLFFSILRYVAGAYIIFMGISLIRSRNEPLMDEVNGRAATLVTSFFSGLFLTFSDLKAILFYASLFPALFDLEAFTIVDFLLVISITAITVGGVKVAYAAMARSLGSRWAGKKIAKQGKLIAGSLMIGTGVVVMAKT